MIENERGAWRGDKTENKWRNQFEAYVFPRWGDLPINRVKRSDVIDLLRQLAQRGKSVMNETHRRIKAVFALAVAEGVIKDNPADGIKPALPKFKAKGNGDHHEFVPYQDVPAGHRTDTGIRPDGGCCAVGNDVPDTHGGKVRGSQGRAVV